MACRYYPHSVCTVHHVAFVRFEARASRRQLQYSFGCPVCVRIIKDKVRLERSRDDGAWFVRLKARRETKKA